MKKREKQPEETGSWMDTYGDMVTLLMCFFVLLYSISTVDQNKYKQLVMSFNPKAIEQAKEGADKMLLNAEISGEEGKEVTGSPPVEESQATSDFDQLYLTLKTMVEEQNMQDSIDVKKGEGFTFITFRDTIFFNGDSSVLREDGKKILDGLADATSKVNASIQRMEVLGHTSQGDPNQQNNVRFDRMLSAQRSAEVTIYLQDRNAVSPEKLVSLSFGQFHPIAGFDTRENRALNRRVEILITKSDAVERSLQEYYDLVDKIK